MSPIVEIALYIGVSILLLPFAISALAKQNILFTFLESGDIKFVMRSGSLFRIIHDVRGRRLTGSLVDGSIMFVNGDEPRNWMERRFGIYWVGFPPFSRVHTFPITKERENLAGTTAEDWIERDDGETRVSSLRFTFPRPFVLRDAELGDRIAIDLLTVGKFEVVNPYLPVFLLKGKFFENMGGVVRGEVIDILKNISGLDAFVAAPKGEVDGILSMLKDPDGPFNRALIKQVGLRLVGMSIPKYDPGDKDVRDAMNAETIAREKNKGVIATAEGYASKLAIETTADASRVEKLAVARGKQIRETVAAVASALGSPDIATRSAADILVMEAATSGTSKLTTLVQGTNVPPVIPIGGNKS